MALKVLMMGGRRCGKTSALASLFYEMIHGKTNQYLTVSDLTIMEEKEDPITHEKEKKDMLYSKRLELTRFIQKAGNNIFLADVKPTKFFWDYNLKLQLPGTSKFMQIDFRDSAGEFFDAGSVHHEQTMQFVKECDVFVVAVDTPYMMAGTDYENEAANIKDSLHTFLTSIDQTSNKAKQVIFVPIKCEKWIQEGKADELVAKVRETYDATIKDLRASNKTEICIIPIQTAGDILFAELRDPYILVDTQTGEKVKCSKFSDRMVILKDGRYRKITEKEVLEEDPEGVFQNAPDIPRPTAWFHLSTDHEASYKPHNCEQLPLYIIRFMLNKALSEKWTIVPDWLRKKFNLITIQELQSAILGMTQAGLFKENIDGIEVVKNCFIGLNPNKPITQ